MTPKFRIGERVIVVKTFNRFKHLLNTSTYIISIERATYNSQTMKYYRSSDGKEFVYNLDIVKQGVVVPEHAIRKYFPDNGLSFEEMMKTTRDMETS